MYSECVSLAFVTQQTKRLRRITSILSFVACLSLPYFSHYLINGTIFEKKKVIASEVYVLFFSTPLSETFFIMRKIEGDVIINVYWSSCKAPVILVRF
jgi:hypothetical protein